MMKGPAGTLIITPPAKLLNSDSGDFDMAIPPHSRQENGDCLKGLTLVAHGRRTSWTSRPGRSKPPVRSYHITPRHGFATKSYRIKPFRIRGRLIVSVGFCRRIVSSRRLMQRRIPIPKSARSGVDAPKDRPLSLVEKYDWGIQGFDRFSTPKCGRQAVDHVRL